MTLYRIILDFCNTDNNNPVSNISHRERQSGNGGGIGRRPVSLSYVTLTLDLADAQGNYLTQGTAALVPSAVLTDSADHLIAGTQPVTVPFRAGAGAPQVRLLATDDPDLQPSGWTWALTPPSASGIAPFSFFLPAGPLSFTATDASPCVFTATGGAFANGTSVTLAGGSLPAGFAASVTYYVVGASGDTFQLAATPGGGPIASTSTGSGSVTTTGLYLSALAPVSSGTAFTALMPLPSGTPVSGDVPVATGAGNASAWTSVSGTGTVTSVTVESANGLAGTVADSTSTPQITLSTTITGLLKGNGSAFSAAAAGTDYLAPNGSGAALSGITAAQAGADASGAASSALASAESFATASVGTETTRAETAEALLAPKASPALTGTPTAPTAGALTSSTQLATTAYADSAVAAEASRATAAEALKAPLASPGLTGTPTAPTKTALANSTAIATTAYADAAVAAEVTRAEAAEVLALPKAGGTMTGWLAPAVAALTFASSILVNAALGNAFAVTLTASTGTLANPTNPVDGQVIRVRVIQDGSGSRTLAYGTAYDFGTAGAPTLSTAAGKVDILGFEYVASLTKWAYLGSGLGF